MVATVLWCIWKDRNQFIFNHHTLNPHRTLFNATTSKDCFSAWNRKAPKKNQCQGEYEKWHPPPPGTLIVNIDASFNIIGDTNRSPEVQVQPISSCSESRSSALTQCTPVQNRIKSPDQAIPHPSITPAGAPTMQNRYKVMQNNS